MGYAVKLEIFEGPLDLLLHLVSKERLDVADVSIATITDDYLRAVKAMGEVDLETASAFLVLAATLLELKSLKLLPRTQVDDPELALLLEERDHLLHRLIEYSTFRTAAGAFEEMLRSTEGFHSRRAELPVELVPALPDILEGLTALRLARAAAKSLAPKPKVSLEATHVTPIRVSVGEMVELLRSMFQSGGVTSFTEVRRGAANRIEVIVRFLALLQMYKDQAIELEQEKPFDEIIVRWRQPL